MRRGGHSSLFSHNQRRKQKNKPCSGCLRRLSLSKNFYLEVVGPNATEVGGDKWMMLSVEGSGCHRKWIGDHLSCLPNEQPWKISWKANLQPVENLSPTAGRAEASLSD